MYNKEELIESVERVLNFNIDYEINEDSVPQLIEKWSKNKSKFITMFGDKLMIKTKDIVVEKSVEEKKLILGEFISLSLIFVMMFLQVIYVFYKIS